MTQWFRPDNTDGYSPYELACMNRAVAEYLVERNVIDDDHSLYRETVKTACDIVADRMSITGSAFGG